MDWRGGRWGGGGETEEQVDGRARAGPARLTTSDVGRRGGEPRVPGKGLGPAGWKETGTYRRRAGPGRRRAEPGRNGQGLGGHRPPRRPFMLSSWTRSETR